MANRQYYIGIMSGTSADGIDLALVNFQDNHISLVDSDFTPYSEALYQRVTSLYSPADNELDCAFSLSKTLAFAYADAINKFLIKCNVSASDIIAIGNHGQTIRHRPEGTSISSHPYTLQIGCHQTLAIETGIRVIGDFRTKDMALGGQGAPLVPAFHQALFSSQQQDTFIVNIGGIANITYLPKHQTDPVLGFDTGPGNTLIDYWCHQHLQLRYDKSGAWGAAGKINEQLLTSLLTEPYFSKPYPKSTGREFFNKEWLTNKLLNDDVSAIDIQATITALTAKTITDEILNISQTGNVYLAGGGIENQFLVSLIKQYVPSFDVRLISTLKVNNDAFEAMAFAWLAFAYDKKFYGNIPAVTGAREKAVLGIEFSP